MPIQTIEISNAEVDKLLLMNEDQFTEIKSVSVSPANLTKTISAFANSDGGDLFIGVEDSTSRTWSGFSDPEAANGYIQIFETLFPLGADFSYEFLKNGSHSGLVLFAHINKTKGIMKASNGIPYIRRGAQNLPQSSAEQLKRLELAKGISSFETDTVNASVDVIASSEVVKGFIEKVVPTTTPVLWLKKQALIREAMPTVAGLVLFADEPQAQLPKHCSVKIYRYKTKEAEGFREALAFIPETIEGPLYSQIAQSVKRTVEIVESIPRMGDASLEKIKYPPEALHEIITNAIIHRDYSIADDVHIRVFDNRIEIQSPGALPAHITPSNILNERFARNGAIVRILNKFPDPPNKDVGEGLNTAFEALEKIGLKDPIISERGANVLVVIKHEPLASPEEAIMDYLSRNPTINNRQARHITHIAADYRIKSIFGRMVKAGFIEQVPDTKTFNTCYRKKT
jgi:ATP-dependent DNA helicase RecG